MVPLCIPLNVHMSTVCWRSDDFSLAVSIGLCLHPLLLMLQAEGTSISGTTYWYRGLFLLHLTVGYLDGQWTWKSHARRQYNPSLAIVGKIPQENATQQNGKDSLYGVSLVDYFQEVLRSLVFLITLSFWNVRIVSQLLVRCPCQPLASSASFAKAKQAWEEKLSSQRDCPISCILLFELMVTFPPQDMRTYLTRAQVISAASLWDVPVLESCRMAMWGSIHIFVRHMSWFRLQQTHLLGEQSSNLSYSIVPHTLILNEHCLKVTLSRMQVGTMTQKRKKSYFPCTVTVVLRDVRSLSVFHCLSFFPCVMEPYPSAICSSKGTGEVVGAHLLLCLVWCPGREGCRCGPTDMASKNLSVSGPWSAATPRVEYR